MLSDHFNVLKKIMWVWDKNNGEMCVQKYFTLKLKDFFEKIYF